MLYRKDNKTLEYVRVSFIDRIMNNVSLVMILPLLLVVLGLTTFRSGDVDNVDRFSEKEIMIIMNNYDKFTPKKLVREIKRRNFRFPHIVYAQAILETGEFTSNIFKENNNLFGMREARVRVNTAITTRRNHAYYNNWRESLEDYGYYCCTYLNKLKTEEEYFNYLSQNYAEASDYVDRVKRIIEQNNIEELFDVKK